MMNRINLDDRPLILVTGATGAQGGGVARQLLARRRFAARVLTRSPRSGAARVLRELGAEIVRGDLADLDSLRIAMGGCYGVSGVTSLCTRLVDDQSYGINLMDAAADTGVGHLVLGALGPILAPNENLHTFRQDEDEYLTKYARDLALPVTFVHAGCHVDEVVARLSPQRRQNESRLSEPPAREWRLISVARVGPEEIAGIVATIFERREEFVGKSVYLVGDDSIPAEYAAVVSRISATGVTEQRVPTPL